MENNREKIKETLKKITSKKYFDVVFVIVINILFFALCHILFTPQYEQVDDFMIMTLISKADGMYTIYGIQIHPIICAIIILLYKTGININWYTVFLLVMQFISFTIIGTLFIKKNKILGIPIYIAFILMIYTKMLIYIQYTTVSMLCIVAGIMLLINYMQNRKTTKALLILAVLMIAVGCMIRFSTIFIAIPFIVICFIIKLIKDKDVKDLKLVLIVFLTILLVYVSFNIIYNVNPTYKEFLKFHNARTYLHDYKILGYYDYQNLFDSVGWSGNDRDAFYGYLYGDEETYSIENLEKLKEGALREKHNYNFFAKLNEALVDFVDSIKKDNYKYIFLLAVVLLIFNNICIISKNVKDKSEDREDNIRICYINLTFITVILIHFLFILLDRPMLRVIISCYILCITMLIYEFLENFNLKKFLKYIFILAIYTVCLLGFKKDIETARVYDKEKYSVYKEIIEYTSENKQNAYLYTLSMHDRFFAYSIYEKIPEEKFLNLRSIGDWDMYTENYYYFKKTYDIDNLMKSLIQKDNVYLISANVIWREDIEIITEYFKENYGIDINVDIIKEFKNDIKIYKLKEI